MSTRQLLLLANLLLDGRQTAWECANAAVSAGEQTALGPGVDRIDPLTIRQEQHDLRREPGVCFDLQREATIVSNRPGDGCALEASSVAVVLNNVS